MKSYILIAALSMTLLSCGKDLDILPEQNVEEGIVLNSDEKVKKVLNGAYDVMASTDLYGGDLQLFSELLAADDEIRWRGTYNEPKEVADKAMTATNSFITATWLRAYNLINITNNILSALDVVVEADRDRVKGEALFLRGAMYFELVKLFSKPYSAGNVTSNPGVPIVLTPTRGIDQSSYVARSSVEATYAQALSDLKEAENLLPVENGVYAQKVAAAAILSRVYLQMADYPGARDAANRAINYDGFAFATPYAKAFNAGKISKDDPESSLPESIFKTVVSAQDGGNDMFIYWSITYYGARSGDVSIEQKHLDLYPAGDARKDFFYKGTGNNLGGTNTMTRSGKWKYVNCAVTMIRLAEMYLTRAESNFRLGTTVGAAPLDDVNEIRTKHAALSPYGSVDLNTILLERKLELAHEGQGAADLKRLKKSANGFAYDADKMVFPIPQREVDASRKVIIQNPGYNP
ncbi:MAG: RagB/SusD family nutrient uptake outer membrane protein [Chitinophagaceae bacterium]|nr:MAG: RagB/SusD family nutrient uptake outer membrane protein [Chitinophagaceae bacterium]